MRTHAHRSRSQLPTLLVLPLLLQACWDGYDGKAAVGGEDTGESSGGASGGSVSTEECASVPAARNYPAMAWFYTDTPIERTEDGRTWTVERGFVLYGGLDPTEPET